MKPSRAFARAAEAAAEGLETLIGSLPPGAAARVGRGLGRLAHGVFRVRREVVESQIAASFPDRDPAWVRDTARRCYLHFGEEITVLARPTPKRVARAIARLANPDEWLRTHRAHVPEGGGAVIVTAHLGNWELSGAQIAAGGVPLTALVRRQRGSFDRRIQGLRRTLGMEVVYEDGSARALARAVRAGRTVGLVADQRTKRGGVLVPFFGRPAWTSRSPARLALACRVPLFLGAMVREGDGYHGLFERVDTPEHAGRDEALTAAWVGRLEDWVRRYPSQYFWFHRRWRGAGAGTSREAAAYEPSMDNAAEKTA